MKPNEFSQNLEAALTACLRALADALQSNCASWAKTLLVDADTSRETFQPNTPLADKFAFIDRIRQYFGGMCSLNDTPRSSSIDAASDRLYDAVSELLRDYWRQMGNEHHDRSRFTLLPAGTVVKFVPGTTMYYKGDYSKRTITDQRWVREQTWIIEGDAGPDITNMPTCWVKQGSQHMRVRCESIVPT